MTSREDSFGLSDARMLLEQLRIAARSDGASPKSFALLLRRVFEERAWENEGFATFHAYMTTPEPVGLGMAKDKLMDAARLADVEPLALSLLREEIPAEAHDGGDRRSPDFQSRVTRLKADTKTDGVERVVARLKRDDPALAERVVRGEVTPNAAAREKGWRKPRILLTTPERVAEAIRRHMPAESITRLARLLMAADESEPPHEKPED